MLGLKNCLFLCLCKKKLPLIAANFSILFILVGFIKGMPTAHALSHSFETTVAASQPFLYYKASGNGLWFDVKTHRKAFVGLGKDCGRSQYWIEFRNPGDIIISEAGDVRTSKSGLSFTLSEDKYTRFWIAWDCKSLWAGIGYSSNVVNSCSISSPLNYVTFTTKDPIHTCSYKFAVPPFYLRIPPVLNETKITGGKLEWKFCENQLPDEAVIGGHIDGEIVYVVRAHHRESLTPGVFVPSKGLAFIPWGGSDNPTSDFEALCGFNLKWKAASAERIFVDAFVAGYSEDHQEPLYIGRGFHENNIIPGKVQLTHKVCYIAHQGREIAVKKFEVLTQPGLNVYCDNEFITPRTRLDFDFVDDAMDDVEEEEDEEVVIF